MTMGKYTRVEGLQQLMLDPLTKKWSKKPEYSDTPSAIHATEKERERLYEAFGVKDLSDYLPAYGLIDGRKADMVLIDDIQKEKKMKAVVRPTGNNAPYAIGEELEDIRGLIRYFQGLSSEGSFVVADVFDKDGDLIGSVRPNYGIQDPHYVFDPAKPPEVVDAVSDKVIGFQVPPNEDEES